MRIHYHSFLVAIVAAGILDESRLGAVLAFSSASASQSASTSALHASDDPLAYFAAPEADLASKKAAIRSELTRRAMLEGRLRSEGRLFPELDGEIGTGPANIPLLDGWTMDDLGRLVGAVSNHPVYADGDIITTSPMSYDPTVAAEVRGVVTTDSGSQYRLGRSKEVADVERRMAQLAQERQVREAAEAAARAREVAARAGARAGAAEEEKKKRQEEEVEVEAATGGSGGTASTFFADVTDAEKGEQVTPATPDEAQQSRKGPGGFKIGDMFRWNKPTDESLGSALGISGAGTSSPSSSSSDQPVLGKTPEALAAEEEAAREEAKKRLGNAVRSFGGLAWNVTKTATKIGAGLVEVAAATAAEAAEKENQKKQAQKEADLNDSVQRVLEEASEAVADAEKALLPDQAEEAAAASVSASTPALSLPEEPESVSEDETMKSDVDTLEEDLVAAGEAAAATAEAQRIEQERFAFQRALLEERIASDKAAAERLDQERLEADRIAAEKAEAKRLEQERLEQERLEQERIAAEKAEAKRLEQERLEQERLEQERIAAEKAEAERLEQERLEQERIAAEKAEAERLEQERLEQERLEQERLEQERIAAEKAEAERLEQERIKYEKQVEKKKAVSFAFHRSLLSTKLAMDRRAAEIRLAEAKIAGEALVTATAPEQSSDTNEGGNLIDLESFDSPQDLCSSVDAEILKDELSRIGLKCGGAPMDRAKRLFLVKQMPLEDIPKKNWAEFRGPGISAAEAEAARTEADRLAAEKAEAQRAEQERIAAEKAAAEAAEAARLEELRIAEERAAAEAARLEELRIAEERAAAEAAEAARLEELRIAEEKAAAEAAEAQRLQEERVAAEKAAAEEAAKAAEEARISEEREELKRIEERNRMVRERLEAKQMEKFEQMATEKEEEISVASAAVATSNNGQVEAPSRSNIWEKVEFGWRVGNRHFEGDEVKSLASPIATVFDQNMFLRLHLIDESKVEIELRVGNELDGDLTIRNAEIFLYCADEYGRRVDAHAVGLENGSCSLPDDPTSFGRCGFELKRGRRAVSRQMLLQQAISSGVRVNASFEVERPAGSGGAPGRAVIEGAADGVAVDTGSTTATSNEGAQPGNTEVTPKSKPKVIPINSSWGSSNQMY